MSATHRHRDACLPIVLAVAFFVLAPRSSAAMKGGSPGGAPFALGGAGSFGSTFAHGAFKSGHFGGHRFGHRRHGQDFFPFVSSGFPYYDYAYEPECDGHPCYPEERRPPRRQHSGYCDVSGRYPQDCVWKDGP